MLGPPAELRCVWWGSGWGSGRWGDSWVLCPVHLCCSGNASQPAESARGGPRMSQKPRHSSRSRSFPFPPPGSKRASLSQEPFAHFLDFLATYFLVPALYSCSPNNFFTPVLLCWKEKTLTFQPRWRPSGRPWLLTLVRAGPGLSSLHPAAPGHPRGPVGAGAPLFFQSPPAGCPPSWRSPTPGVPSLFPFEEKEKCIFFPSYKRRIHGECRNLDNTEHQKIKLKITHRAPPKENH